ncbi:hypothetical protein EVAR_54732_1 [Eumeta japonica]|uniref:Uncharacterized protein n=1 Tax=Eumeta variegata TaxID=151549 RepID=A0A4C1YZW5_EUMVA|nr:hypothetical protein EVAR_54732_1 [Eumeta japonica]
MRDVQFYVYIYLVLAFACGCLRMMWWAFRTSFIKRILSSSRHRKVISNDEPVAICDFRSTSSARAARVNCVRGRPVDTAPARYCN